MTRIAVVEYATKETRTQVTLNLDGSGQHSVDTGIGYLNHMLEQLAFHGLLDLDLRCQGDLEIDTHHTTEDVAIAIGQAMAKALGDRSGIRRYAHCLYPMDETLVQVALDISGRPELHFKGSFTAAKLGALDTQMIPHFFKSVALHAGLTLHMTVLYGENDHHKAEGLFKAFARAFSDAVLPEPRRQGVASTKGKLGVS